MDRTTAEGRRGDQSVDANHPARVREIEERSLNAWPALSRVFLDGWIVGLSEGYNPTGELG